MEPAFYATVHDPLLRSEAGAVVITEDECIKQAHECSHQARQRGVIKRQRNVLYAMSRTWDTLARQTALLAELQAEEVKQPVSSAA